MQPTYNPYAPPAAVVQPGGPSQGGFTAFLEGDKLVVQKEAPLPPVCVKCGSREVVTRRRQQFVWNPPWLIVLVLVSWLLGLIVMLIVQKKGSLHLPLCAPCEQRRKNGVWLGVLAALALVLGLVGAGILGAAVDPVAGILLLVATLAGFIVLLVRTRGRFVTASKVDDRMIWLRYVHPDAANAAVDASRGMFR